MAGDRRLIDYLHNRARSFIYSTALAPPVLGAIGRPWRSWPEEPERRALSPGGGREHFGEALTQAGLDTLGSATQIVPVLVGENARTLEFAARLRQQGLMAVALRPPTVPPGQARVRFSLSAAHSREDLARRPGGHHSGGPQDGSHRMTNLVFSARLGYLRPYLAPPNRGLGQGGTDGINPYLPFLGGFLAGGLSKKIAPG